ncbi:MAG: divergent polysaccharide deacetylase family protein [Desulfobacteraceae bacterium]|nr:MAG: divergent polysaccharide deacetylase family protein [Desulfobacteraceae bacterium]
MARKRVKVKPGARKARKKPAWPFPFLKILIGLAVLVLLVLGAGLLADLLIDRSSRAPIFAALRPDKRFQVPPVQTSKTPATHVPDPQVYEVFPRNSLPEVKPPAPLPQLPANQPPMVAIIIDDIGYDRHVAEQFMSLDASLTLSLLPNGPFSQAISAQARSKGLEIMLHLPMEPNEYPEVNPGSDALLAGMTPDELIAQLDKNIARLSGIKGVNNHMGSRISASSEQMRQIFSILKMRGLFYVDSRTSADTVAQGSARLLQLPFAERDIFIDHLDNAEFIRSQLNRLVQRALKQGYAIGIAHPYQTTYRVLRESMPQLKERVTLVPASLVVEHVTIAQAAKTSPGRY